MPSQIIDLVERSGLKSIEWGGDVHVPHGDLKTARSVRQMTREANLAVSAYGSYYRLGESEKEGLSFSSVLDTADALNAPTIRVWAGRKGSNDASTRYRKLVVDDAFRIADLAGRRGLSISYEYHPKTLTDTDRSARELLEATNQANIFAFWQPRNFSNIEERITSLEQVLARLANFHIFHWKDFSQRFALADGEDLWLPILKLVQNSGRTHHVSIEFVKDDNPSAFLYDAYTLKAMLRHLGANLDS